MDGASRTIVAQCKRYLNPAQLQSAMVCRDSVMHRPGNICNQALTRKFEDSEDARQFFEEHFFPAAVVGRDGPDGLFLPAIMSQN